MEAHALAEERSRVLHALIAERLRRQPELASRARERVAQWLANGEVARSYAESWAALLDGPLASLCELLAADSEEARALRGVSPFAGLLSPQERWRVWREVREANS